MRGLKLIREQRGLSLRELAAQVGLGASTIGNFETGKTDMSAASKTVLAEFLKTSVEELSREIPLAPRTQTFWREAILENLGRFTVEQLLEISQTCLSSSDPNDLEASRIILAEAQKRIEKVSSKK